MTRIELEKKVAKFIEEGGKVERLSPDTPFLQIELEAEAYLKNPEGHANLAMNEIEAFTAL